MSGDGLYTIRLDGELYRITKAGIRLRWMCRGLTVAAVVAIALSDVIVGSVGPASVRFMTVLALSGGAIGVMLTGLVMRHARPVIPFAAAPSDPPLRLVRPFWPLRDVYAITEAKFQGYWLSEVLCTLVMVACAAGLIVDEAGRGRLGFLALIGVVAACFLPRGTLRGATRIP